MFEKLSRVVDFKLLIIGGQKFSTSKFKYEILPWSETQESQMIEQIDVGIMPLNDTKWEKGKCGYKLIQYMACAKPIVASAVGMNCEIIEHGLNGFLVKSEEEWIQSFIALDKSESRSKMGQYARKKVEKEYSLQSTLQQRIDYIKENVL
jgi:glycosyltransferase involved in cell wall biosynthesis